MAVTRDPEYPAEAAQLMQAFNVASDGFTAETVLNASLQMVIASIGFIAKQRGVGREGAVEYAGTVVGLIQAGINENWERAATPTDLPVRPQ